MSGEPGAMSGQPRPDHGEAPNPEPAAPPSTDATAMPTDAGAIPPAETGAAAFAIPEAGGAVHPVPEPAAETAAGAALAPTAETAAADAAAAATGAAAADAGLAVPARRPRRLAVLAGVTRVLRFAVMLALLTVGAAIGYQSFLTSRPAPTGPIADPATAGNLPAPVVREFLAAVGRNDADAIRSTVPAEPYKSLTAEMSRWEIHEVTKVDTLATFEDGQRTATAFVMIGRDSGQNPVAINLIVETQAGNIVGFK